MLTTNLSFWPVLQADLFSDGSRVSDIGTLGPLVINTRITNLATVLDFSSTKLFCHVLMCARSL